MPDDAATGRVANPSPAGYPARWAADVVLADGATVHVRPIRPDDAARIHAFHARQSPESIYFRYFTPHPTLSDDEVEKLVHVDYQDRMAFVALRDEDLLGVARYDRWPARSEAEVAFFVDDAHRGRGIATLLLEYLSVAAREVGISAFTATVLPSNRRMVSVFQQAGFRTTSSFEEGVIEVRLDLQPTPEAEAAIDARAQRAATRAVQLLMEPRSVAVIGASRDRGSVGHEVLRNLVAHEFAGPVYPVNRAVVDGWAGGGGDADGDSRAWLAGAGDAGAGGATTSRIGAHVAGVPAVGAIGDIPDRVDLAVVCVPAPEVPGVLEECGRRAVRAAIVISSGFAEVGGEGAALSDATLRVARRFGIRLLGPNCLGVINTDPRVRLHATFATPHPRRGKVALLAESGTIGGVVIDHMEALGLGISSFAAIGNRADVSANDLLQYWADDPRTEVVLLNLESFGNPRNFSRIARQLARTKPVVAVKSGRAVQAYPGDGDDQLPADTAGALLRQTGIIRVDTLGQLLDVGRVLATIPQLPAGPRVAVVGNAGGSLVTAADACVDAGLVLAEPEGVRRLMRKIAATKLCDNPFDVGYLAPARDLERLLREALRDDGVDSVLLVGAPSPRLGPTDFGQVIEAARPAAPDKPLVACVFGPHSATMARTGSGRDDGRGSTDGGSGVAVFDFPDDAAYALGRVTRYARWRAEPEGRLVDPEGVAPADARRAAGDALDAYGEGWLGPTVTADILRTVAIDPIATRVVDGVEAAVAAAEEVGYPVAVKSLARNRLAKSEAAGLALDVQGDDDLRATCDRLVAALGEVAFPAVVQPMVPPGVDVAVGVVHHPLLGPVLSLSAGGVATPVAEARVQVLPLTDLDAQRCVAGSTVAGLLDPTSRQRLEDLLLRVGALVEAAPEIDALELNPVILSPSAAAVADARLRVAPTNRDATPPVRRI